MSWVSKLLDHAASTLDAKVEEAKQLAKFDGRFDVGPVTLHGATAMDWQAELSVPALGVVLCFHPTTARRGWCFYASPNRTPWAAVLGCGPGLEKNNVDRITTRLRILSDSPRSEDEVQKLSATYGLTSGTYQSGEYLGTA